MFISYHNLDGKKIWSSACADDITSTDVIELLAKSSAVLQNWLPAPQTDLDGESWGIFTVGPLPAIVILGPDERHGNLSSFSAGRIYSRTRAHGEIILTGHEDDAASVDFDL